MGIIISAFPGMGKTLHTTMKTYGLSYSDSDSSKFKWIINDAGEKVVNPDFPNNYVAHIMEAVKTHDIVFVSTHQEVREALKDVYKIIMYPAKDLKAEYLEKYRTRFSGLHDEKFVSMMDSNWDSFIDSVMHPSFNEKSIRVRYERSRNIHPDDIFTIGQFIDEEDIIKQGDHLIIRKKCMSISTHSHGPVNIGNIDEFYRELNAVCLKIFEFRTKVNP